MVDLIDRQAAINALIRKMQPHDNGDGTMTICVMSEAVIRETLNSLPALHPPTLRGYKIEHLDIIARLLSKEDLPPERVSEALTDIERIVEMVKGEYEEALKRMVEKYQ